MSISVHRAGYHLTKKKPRRRKGRYLSIDDSGELRILTAKGERCKDCIHYKVPLNTPPCLKCLEISTEGSFPNFVQKK